MGNWDFLLQKKGDRQWVTAHKSTLKLKTGEYRLAAKGDISTDVAITIAFESPNAADTSTANSQTRVKRTNAKGLLAIIPFTSLKPGTWTITCQSIDPNNPWESSLCLQILAATPAKPQTFRPLPLPPNPNLFSFEGSLSQEQQDGDKPVDTEETVLGRSLAKLMAARGETATSESLKDMVEATLQDMEDTAETTDDLDEWSGDGATSDLLQSSLQELDALLQADLEPVWQEMDQAAQQQTETTTKPSVPQPDFLGIALAQNVYIWGGDRPVVLRGNLTELAPVSATFQGQLTDLSLRFVLRNPQNSTQLLEVTQPISAAHLPESFRQELLVNPTLETLAIVGEISLETNAPQPTVLAVQSFNLIADYQAIAASVKLPEPPPEDEALLNENDVSLHAPFAGSNPIIAETVPPEPREPSILPPKLRTQSSSEPHTPELPSFMQPAEVEDPMEEAVLEEAWQEESNMLALPGGEDPVILGERIPDATTTNETAPVDPDEIPYPFVFDAESEAVQPPDPMPAATTPEPESAEEPEPEPEADLDWNSRFFTRLNTLAADTEDSSWLAEEEPEPETEPEMIPETVTDEDGVVVIFQKDVIPATEAIADPSIEAASEIFTPQPREKTQRQTMEIVVDSLWDEQAALEEKPEPIQPIYDASGLPYPQEFLDQTENPADEAMAQPVPEPVLNLSKPEYHAKDMAVVRVTLPPYPDRLYVKLWMQDRQTRNLLAGPHQLTDFSVNRDGNVETLMQMQIPPGSTEVRFEAIAINPRYRAESRKVGIDRRVSPTNVSEINWDDLGV